MTKELKNIHLYGLDAPNILSAINQMISITERDIVAAVKSSDLELVNSIYVDFFDGVKGFASVMSEIVINERDIEEVHAEWEMKNKGN